jgi:hypothetical protein
VDFCEYVVGDEYSVGQSCYMPLLHLMNDLRSRGETKEFGVFMLLCNVHVCMLARGENG